MNRKYKLALHTTGRGMSMLAVCLFGTSKGALFDLGKGIAKHPILTAILLGVYIMMFTAMGSARAERDSQAKTAYIYQQKTDSLEIILHH